MSKRISAILAVAAIVGLVVVVFVAYTFLKTPEEASQPIAALPIATPAPATLTPAPTQAPAAILTTEAAEADSSATPASEPAAGPTPGPGPAATGPVIFEIVQQATEARFVIQEVLRGADNTVVGVTNQAAGQISIDAANPANSQIGVIQVNARTLTTDNNFRNRAIKNQILRTNDFEFITFAPTEIRGMPASVLPGDTVAFQVAGNLTITDVTRPVVFDVTVTAVSTEQIKGLAETRILWRDFGLFIPDSPSVDTVADDVTLQLEFTANQVDG
ncbi:MAG: YceI family protein [Caldilineales bacterium]|nr:YceI family protein [Caldilineales bacterium]